MFDDARSTFRPKNARPGGADSKGDVPARIAATPRFGDDRSAAADQEERGAVAAAASPSSPRGESLERRPFGGGPATGPRSRVALLLGSLVLLSSANPAASAQHRAPTPDVAKVPEALRLKGDPAIEGDLGALRAPPAPARSTPDGPVMWLAATCRTCAASGATAKSAATPALDDRLLGMPRDAAEAWIERISGVRPEIVSTRRATLVYVAKSASNEKTSANEAARLRVFFPKLPAEPTALDAHGAAHLWAERLVALEADLAELLDLDDEGRLKARSGPYADTPFEKSEIFLFCDGATASVFEAFLLGDDKGARPEGIVFKGRPIAWATLDHPAPGVDRRRFAFAAASALLRGLMRTDSALPPWLRVGVAHILEHRAAARSPRFDDADSKTIPPDPFDSNVRPPNDRDALLRAMADEGRAPRLDALAASGADGLSVQVRVASFGLARYLAGVDRKKFAALVSTVASSTGTSDRGRAFAEAFKAVYGADEATLDNAWRAWAAGKR
jgi:hypothetical protein